MPRTADSLGVPSSQSWPPAGWHDCKCIGVESMKSSKKGTPGLTLTWQTADAEYAFDDTLWLTTGAIRRVNLVALRVCGLPRDHLLPDEEREALKALARFVKDNVKGKRARVQIEANREEFIDPDPGSATFGQTRSFTRHRVAYAGYDAPKSPAATGNDLSPIDEHGQPVEDDLPF